MDVVAHTTNSRLLQLLKCEGLGLQDLLKEVFVTSETGLKRATLAPRDFL